MQGNPLAHPIGTPQTAYNAHHAYYAHPHRASRITHHARLTRVAHTLTTIYTRSKPPATPINTALHTPDRSRKTPQFAGLSPPPKHPKTTQITFFRAIRRGQCSVFHVKTVHPNVHPLYTFRFSVYTQTYTQLYTQPRKTPLSASISNPQNAKTARTPPFSVFKPFKIRLSPVNSTFYITLLGEGRGGFPPCSHVSVRPV